ncbi:hypothetical protein PROFUN_02933 [Planoprotostelium fungivorum]|uniref:EF-hand domain-containing protein n=1 Tax=Planoprotostelium fungivorum TaxID=1890364 RepID=A0A2P6NS45_9EUKA|nr:hypothetical protein PROFUN_02933 [Planoprotostelium fungivorum]
MTSVPSLITSLNNALFVRSISIVQTGSPYKIAEIEQEKYSRVRMIVQNILDNWRVQFFKCIDQDGDGIVSIDYLLEQMEAKLEDCRPKFMLLRNIRECPAKTMGYNTFMSVLDNDRHFGKHLVVNSIHPLLHINPHQSDIKRGSVQREYGVIFKEWKQVWMVLTEDALYFYKQEIVDLRFCEAVEMTQTSFRLRSADGPIHIKTDHLIRNMERMKRHREVSLSRQKKTYVSKLAGELDELDMTPMSDDAEELMDQMHEIEDNVTTRRIIRNFGIPFGIWLTLMILMTTVSQCRTTVDFLIVFNTTPVQSAETIEHERRETLREENPHKRPPPEALPPHLPPLSPSLSPPSSSSSGLHTRSPSTRFYRFHSQCRFDFTAFNSDHDALVTILSLVLPGIAVLFLAQLVGHVMLSREGTATDRGNRTMCNA